VTAMAADARPPRRGCAVPRRAVPCRAPRGVLALPGAPGRYSACRLSFSVLCGKLSLFLFKYLGNRACYLAEDLCQWLFFFFFSRDWASRSVRCAAIEAVRLLPFQSSTLRGSIQTASNGTGEPCAVKAVLCSASIESRRAGHGAACAGAELQHRTQSSVVLEF